MTDAEKLDLIKKSAEQGAEAQRKLIEQYNLEKSKSKGGEETHG